MTQGGSPSACSAGTGAGADDLAYRVAAILGAAPVVTSATRPDHQATYDGGDGGPNPGA